MNLMHDKGRSAIRSLPGNQRMRVFLKTAELLKETQKDFISVLVKGGGKPVNNAKGEVAATIDRLEKTGMEFGYITGQYIPGDWDQETIGSEAIVKREPIGILFAISSFNYPLFISMTKIIPALLLGNAVILKPASAVPLAAIMMARLFEKAGLPKEALAVLPIRGRDTTRILQDKRVRAVSFTGSTGIGQQILQTAGIKQFHLELGGKDPAIVLKDAPIDATVDKVVKGIISNAGQRCDAIRMVIVEQEQYDAFRERLIDKISKLEPKDPTKDETAVMGPLIDEESAKMVEAGYNDAVAKGGRALVPFKRNGTFVWPCLIEIPAESVKNLMAYQEDIFGPLALLIKSKSEEEAIDIANGTVFGLDAAIFGLDEARMRRIARKLEVGAVFLNDAPKHGIGYFPFGGMKDSGIGREGLGYSVHQLTTTKSIITSFRGRGVWDFDY